MGLFDNGDHVRLRADILNELSAIYLKYIIVEYIHDVMILEFKDRDENSFWYFIMINLYNSFRLSLYRLVDTQKGTLYSIIISKIQSNSLGKIKKQRKEIIKFTNLEYLRHKHLAHFDFNTPRKGKEDLNIKTSKSKMLYSFEQVKILWVELLKLLAEQNDIDFDLGVD